MIDGFTLSLILPIITASAIINHYIGNKQWKLWLKYKKYPFLGRPLAYVVSGLLAGGLAFSTGAYSIWMIFLIILIRIAGYIVFRQPPPNKVFYAMTGRWYHEREVGWALEKLEKFIRKTHDFKSHNRLKGQSKELARWGRVWGTYRGMFTIFEGLLYTLFVFKYAILFSFVGLAFGKIHHHSGRFGCRGKEKGARGFAEKLVGGLIIAPLFICSILGGVFVKGLLLG